MLARGELAVKMAPSVPCTAIPDVGSGRFSIDKRFHGEAGCWVPVLRRAARPDILRSNA